MINSLAALLSSLVARLLQGEEDDGGHATMHAAAAAGGSSEDGSSAVLPAEQVGELLLLPLIKSTYRCVCHCVATSVVDCMAAQHA